MFFIGLGSLFESLTYLWLWIAIAFAIIEAFTVGIVSIWFSIGAIAALLTSLITDNLFIQLVVFLMTSAFLLVKTRKIAVEKLKIGQHKTNIDGLIGEECIVTTAIKSFEPGEVKLNGKIWRAVSESHQAYEVGELVYVLRIEGVSIIIK